MNFLAIRFIHTSHTSKQSQAHRGVRSIKPKALALVTRRGGIERTITASSEELGDRSEAEKWSRYLRAGVNVVLDGKVLLQCLWQMGIDTMGMVFHDLVAAQRCLSLGVDPDPYRQKSELQMLLEAHAMTPAPILGGTTRVTDPRDLLRRPTDVERAHWEAVTIQEIYRLQVKEIEKRGLTGYLRDVEFPYMISNARIEWTGVRVSVQRLGTVRSLLEMKVAHYAGLLKGHGIQSPGSATEFQNYLKANGVTGSLSKEDLVEKKLKEIKGLLRMNPHLTQVITAFFQYRDFRNLRSTWCKDLHFHDNRIHPIHQQLGAKTGRTSMKGIPVSNLPKPLRSLVVGDPGNLIVEYDICAADAVIMAAIFQDQTLLEAYRDGDIYVAIAKKYFAESLLPEDLILPAIAFKEKHGDRRDFCKTLFLSISYGKTAYGIAQEEGIPIEQAQARIDHLLNEFPLIREGLSRLEQEGMKTGFAHIYDGLKRIVHIGHTSAERASAGRIFRNTPIQGLTAVVMKMATVAIDRKLRGTGGKIIFTNHDAFIIETPPECISYVRQAVSQEVLDAGQKISPFLHLKVDCKSESSLYWFHGRGTSDFDDYVGTAS